MLKERLSSILKSCVMLSERLEALCYESDKIFVLPCRCLGSQLFISKNLVYNEKKE